MKQAAPGSNSMAHSFASQSTEAKHALRLLLNRGEARVLKKFPDLQPKILAAVAKMVVIPKSSWVITPGIKTEDDSSELKAITEEEMLASLEPRRRKSKKHRSSRRHKKRVSAKMVIIKPSSEVPDNGRVDGLSAEDPESAVDYNKSMQDVPDTYKLANINRSSVSGNVSFKICFPGYAKLTEHEKKIRSHRYKSSVWGAAYIRNKPKTQDDFRETLADQDASLAEDTNEEHVKMYSLGDVMRTKHFSQATHLAI